MTDNIVIDDYKQILSDINMHNCCSYAYLSAIIFSTANVLDKNLIELRAVNSFITEKLKFLINSIYSDKISCDDVDFDNKKLILISGLALTQLYNDIGFDLINENIISSIIDNDCCKKAFLTMYSIINIKFYASEVMETFSKGYLLELSFINEKICLFFEKVLIDIGFVFKKSFYNTKHILSLKESEKIAEYFAYLGAVKNALELNNSILLRSIKNNVNRQNNCFDANQNKTLDASNQHIKAIKYIKKIVGLEALDDSLLEVAKLRLDNEDASLKELCDLYSQKITRAGMKYKLDRLIHLAEKIKG